MSATQERIPLAEASALAAEVADLVRPACQRIEIAGSIRRRRADVGDIELVCIPRIEADTDLFGQPVAGGGLNALDALCDELRAAGVLADRPDKNGRPACGSRYKRLAYRGVALDLFAVLRPASWGSILTIRTGPGAFSHALVTPRNDLARDPETGRPICPGLCQPWLRHKDGRFVHREDGTEYPTPEEADVFALLGLPYLEPAERADWLAARIAAWRGGR